jgi:hyperosmotically inducible protein
MKISFNQMTAAAVVLPVALFATGCDMKESPSGDTNSMSANTTNSSMTVAGGTNADNSGINVRDRGNTNLTALDQGNSAADLNLTQQIRQSVVSSTNNFSVMAQNIKIITVNGKVTLRGPVQNDMEKSSIGTIARNIAGDGNVDNQLEVKPNP